MKNRIVEITSDNIHLSLERGFLLVSQAKEQIGRVALPDIGAVIARGYGATLSLNLAAKLAELNIPLILCGADQAPASVVWPLSGHHTQSETMTCQAALSLPRRKRLWQAIIRAKIKAQAEALSAVGEDSADLKAMARRVKSGDSDNMEAQASRRYWTRMMGELESGFTRDRDSDGVNAALNYGYTILRSGAVRAILAAGLHPAFSLNHLSRGEAFRLADDMMEPFRPWVDLSVRQLAERPDMGGFATLKTAQKKQLARILTLDLESSYGASPLQLCINRLCQSLADVCLKERNDLEFSGAPIFGAIQTEASG